MAVEILDPAPPKEGDALYYEPSSWAQQQFELSEAPDLLYSAGVGKGKTIAACRKADKRCWTHKDARIAITRLYRSDIGASIGDFLLNKVITPKHREWGYSPAADGGSTLVYPTGSQIMLLGLDRPTRLQSTEFDMIIIEQAEETKATQWDYASGRLRNKARKLDKNGNVTDELAYLQCAGCCNPAGPEHYLYRKFRPDRGSHRIWSETETKLEDGTIIPPGDLVADCIVGGPMDNLENLGVAYRTRLQRKTGRYYERMVLGKWVAFEGVVYDVFNRDLHVISRPRSWDEWGGVPPPSYEKIRCIDFGYNPDPFVCFDDQTEVLTRRGWQLFKDLTDSDQVATVNERKETEWQTPTHRIDLAYDGEMVLSEGRVEGANFCVTPNHQMVVEDRRTGRWKKTNADGMKQGTDIPVGGWRMKRRGSGKTANFARLIGLVLTDGCLSGGKYVRIAQKNRNQEVRHIIDRAGYRASESVHKTTGVTDFSIGNKKLHDRLKRMGMLKLSREKRVPERCFSWGRDAIQALIDGMMIGDGRQDGRQFLSSSPGLADDFQALCAIVGRPTTRKTMVSRGYNGNPTTLYLVNLTKARRASVQKLKIRTTKYTGRVRCVTVPNGTLIVRRGGRPMVCGNCLWLCRRDARAPWIMYREIYMTNRTVTRHAQQINQLEEEEFDTIKRAARDHGMEEPQFLNIVGSYADHDAEDRATLNDEDIVTEPAEKDVSPGIQTVHEYLAPEMVGGRPRSRIYFIRPEESLVERDLRRAEDESRGGELPTCLIDEITGFRYHPEKPDQFIGERHALDALRYGVFTVRRKSGARIYW